jgi:hypothetical protein
MFLLFKVPQFHIACNQHFRVWNYIKKSVELWNLLKLRKIVPQVPQIKINQNFS